MMLDTGGGGFSSAPSSSSSAANRSSFDSSGWNVNSGGQLPAWAYGAAFVAAFALTAFWLARRL
jgi:hypothetical protein